MKKNFLCLLLFLLLLIPNQACMPGDADASLWKALVARYGSSAGEYDEVRIDASTNSLQTITYEHHEIHSNSHFFIEDYSSLGNEADIDFCLKTADDTAWVHMVFNYQSAADLVLDWYELSDLTMDGTLVVQRANNRAKSFSGQHTPAGSSATVMTDSAASFTVDALIGWTIYNVTDLSSGVITDNDGTTVTVAALLYGTDNDWDQNDYYEINKSLTIVQSECTVTSVGLRMGGGQAGTGSNPSNANLGDGDRSTEIIFRPNIYYLFRFTSAAASNDFSYTSEFYEHTDKN